MFVFEELWSHHLNGHKITTHITWVFLSLDRCVYKLEKLGHNVFKVEINVAAHSF